MMMMIAIPMTEDIINVPFRDSGRFITNFRSSENGFKVLSRVAFATKVFRRLLCS